MTTTPPEAPSGPAPDQGPDTGPRVSAEQMRDLGRLRRTRYDKKVAGVAGGLARHFDLDPLLLRVAFVVLAFFGGAGLIVYGACWLLVPEDDAIQAPLRLDERTRTVALLLAGGIAFLALLGDSLGGGWWAPWPLLVIGLVVYLVLGSRRTPPPPPGTPGYPYGATARPPESASGPLPWPPAGPPTYAAAVQRRQRDPRRSGPLLFWFTMALVALGIGVLGLAEAGGLDVPGSAYPAMALATIGVMLVVGAFYGRAGGLILAGVIATVATLGATAADRVDGGELVFAPQTAAQVDQPYDLWAGEIVLDLTEVADLEQLDGETIRLDATLGRIEVVLPEGLDADIEATVDGAGETTLLGDSRDGSANAEVGDGVGPQITVLARVTLGEIVVRVDERSTR